MQGCATIRTPRRSCETKSERGWGARGVGRREGRSRLGEGTEGQGPRRSFGIIPRPERIERSETANARLVHRAHYPKQDKSAANSQQQKRDIEIIIHKNTSASRCCTSENAMDMPEGFLVRNEVIRAIAVNSACQKAEPRASGKSRLCVKK